MRCTAKAVMSLAIALLPLAVSAAAWARDDAWALLRRPGYVAFLRHADAPGGAGDPPGFRLDDCATQRNLSEAGRAQARRTGEALRERGIVFDRVLTSPWCRCRETAQLVTGREAETMDALGNLFGRRHFTAEQVKSLKAYLAGLDGGTRVLFVTHGVVIQALAGITPAQGEAIVVKAGPDGGVTVAGRLRVD
jgi:broad specificity phosphatase PhoE